MFTARMVTLIKREKAFLKTLATTGLSDKVYAATSESLALAQQNISIEAFKILKTLN
jgi:hypothetical protein